MSSHAHSPRPAESPSGEISRRMAVHDLHEQFLAMHRNVALGDRALVAVAAHIEVRSVLRTSHELRDHGLDDVLIGSYARRVSIWPGKDVDVFGRLMNESVNTLGPETGYAMFGRALQPFADQGRLVPQPRSFKVEYGPGRYPSPQVIRDAAPEFGWEADRVARAIASLAGLAFEFSVDVVPAVTWDSHFGIPEVGVTPQGEIFRTDQWRKTSPVKLTEETRLRNRYPQVAGVGGFVRTVKTVRQVKSHHLTGRKPSALYYEFILHEGFREGAIDGDCWADLTANALSYIAGRLGDVQSRPVCDPILGSLYDPAPGVSDLHEAQAAFDELSRRARRALSADRCQAAIEWRYVCGGNGKVDQVFPLPPGCRSTGVAMGAAASNAATGGTEERSFGGS